MLVKLKCKHIFFKQFSFSYFLGFCKTVLTTSNGWNKTVENNPDAEPAINDFNIGCYKIMIQFTKI